MSKTSTVTARETPVLKAASAAGGLLVHAETLTVQTEQRVELVDATDRIMDYVRGTGIRDSSRCTPTSSTSSSRRSRATPSGSTTTPSSRTATASTPIHICARCCSGTA
jgi:hypothetical protein